MNPLSPSKAARVASWAARLIAAAILTIASLAKLTGAADSVALFSLLGVEPWGRLLLGAIELPTALLLLWPRTAGLGGLLALGLMTGAILTHLLKIGVSYGGDPSLFLMALSTFTAAAATVYLHRGELPFRRSP
ncbi:MAG: DoxX family protein [Gemmatimonadales bacterium]